MISHGVGVSSVYKSIWLIVDAINSCSAFRIKFPTCHRKQREIAEDFRDKSSVGFDNCTEAVDGILIWKNKPSKHILAKAGLGASIFLWKEKMLWT